ncbi:hypothetical protein MSAN_01781100 [Mycena sanguinolenta]|uniref:Uncharacterized protein n=1 Tax=Mycena sanguinolenta TaxID=230812 RepID=A0A8H6XXN7_9AGAR|nr:hypothetical protein MSAN_01781100 [Mycena sanguinolenta]
MVPQGGLDIRRTFDLLRMCSNLVQCEIHVTKNTDRGLTLDMPPIFLPHLDTLLFSNCDFRNWILVAPKLRFLRIGQAYSWHNESMPEAGFLSVDVDPNQLSSPDGLRDLLEYFPMISHLRLSSPSLDHLELFCPPDDLLDLCPELTHLTVISPHNGFSDAAALAFVKARMALPLPLQQFCVRFGRQMKVDVMPELQCFIADGLRVSLEYLAPRWKFDAQEGLNGD